MKNKEKAKAKEIAIRLMGGGDRNIQPLVDALIEMAEWKDEQFAKEKQQLIEKACEWLKTNMYEGTCEQILSKKPYPFMQDFINEFKKAMEE